MRQPSKLRRAAIYGVAGLASAAIGVTAVNSFASAGADQAEPQNSAQAAGNQAAAPQTAAQAKPPAAAQPQVPPTLAVKTAPQQPPAVKSAVKAAVKHTAKPAVKTTAVRTAPKPLLRKKVKAVRHQKSLAPVKRATVTEQAVVRPHNLKLATVRKPFTANAATVIGNAQKALDQAGRDLASARQNLDKAKAEVDSLRKARLPKAPFASPKVSPALAKRLAEHRIGQTKKTPVKNTAHKKG